jgi:hypothetical protein
MKARTRKNMDMDAAKLAEAQKVLGARSETETVDLALDYVRLLEMENRGTGQQSEEWGNYYGDLIAYVAALRDVRAIPALIGAITTGNIAAQGLVDIGDTALPPVLDAWESPDDLTRTAALHTLAKFITAPTPISPSGLAQAKRAVLASLSDTSGTVRSAAVRKVQQWDDPSIDQILEKLASSDPFWYPQRKGRLYPVRIDARRALQERARARRARSPRNDSAAVNKPM